MTPRRRRAASGACALVRELTFSATAALVGWVPVAMFLFLILPTRRALLAVYVLGYLFLPQGEIPIKGALPDYDRNLAMGVSCLLAATVLDLNRLMRLRPRWVDLPLLLWVFCPVASSLTNNLGIYDGLSACLERAIAWGLPYLLGRVYLGSGTGLYELAGAISLGGVLYSPFCLLEARLSPQLHRWVYGWHPASFAQTYRLGGWRPTVFLQHGLAVGMYMSMSTLVATALVLGGALRHYQFLAWLALGFLAVTTVVCRSLGALALLSLGLGVLLSTRLSRSALPLLALTCLPLLYMGSRVAGLGLIEGSVPVVEAVAGADRTQSFTFRLENEEMLAEKAQERLAFGWGGWGRSRVYDDDGRDLSVTDGYWILALGENGLVGLGALTLLHLLPIWLLLRRHPPRTWVGSRELGAAAVLALVLGLTMIDDLLNAMFNPLVALAVGGLLGALTAPVPRARPAAPPVPMSKQELLQLAESQLNRQALARWGHAEYARREQLLAGALKDYEALELDEYRRLCGLLRRVILALGARDLERFLQVSAEQRVKLAEFLTEEGGGEPSAVLAGAEGGQAPG